MDRRSWDIKRSFRRIFYPAAALYFLTIIGSYVIVSAVFKDLWTILITWGLLILLLGVLLIFGAVRFQYKQKILSDFGYNIQKKSTLPYFFNGTREYKRYRKDSRIDGFGAARLAKYITPIHRKLIKRRSEQVDDSCRECGVDLKESGSGYFVEHRRIKRIAFIPVTEEILETEAFCQDHKPDEFI